MISESNGSATNGVAVAPARASAPIRARWRRSVVQAALVGLGMTQADLAPLVGMAAGTISRSVTDSREPTLSETVAVASVLGLGLDQMIEIVPSAASRPKYPAGDAGDALILHRQGTRKK